MGSKNRTTVQDILMLRSLLNTWSDETEIQISLRSRFLQMLILSSLGYTGSGFVSNHHVGFREKGTSGLELSRKHAFRRKHTISQDVTETRLT